MTSFRDIVTAVLRDLTRAQDASNRLSAKLAEKYRDGEILHYFPVPNALAKEVELELKFAVRGADGAAQVETIRPGAAAFRPTARALVEAVLADVRAAVAGPELAAALATAEVRDQLSAQVAHALHHRREQAVQPMDAGRAALWAEEAIRAALTATEEIARALGPERLAEVVSRSRSAWQPHLERLVTVLDALTEEVREPNVDMILDAAALADIPMDHVHVIRIRAELRNYRWVVTESSGAAQLLPEG